MSSRPSRSLERLPAEGSVSVFSLILTERCSWRCVYCYQKRSRQTLDKKILDRVWDGILPLLSAAPVIQFYGGEPLLAFDLIRRTVHRLEREKAKGRLRPIFAVTTNGALLTPDILSFFDEHRFELMLSFDGSAQDEGRRRGSAKILSALLESFPQYPGLRPAVNSVFGPGTVGRLSRSIEDVVARGIPDVFLSFDYQAEWSEQALARLRREVRRVGLFLRDRFPSGRPMPLVNFRRPSASGIFNCSAGRDRLALDPGGRIWGCYAYADFFRARPDAAGRFCFGTVDEIRRAGGALNPKVAAAYAQSRREAAGTRRRVCLDCRHLDRCAHCPPISALKSGEIGLIPEAACRINRIMIRERDLFWERGGGPPAAARPARSGRRSLRAGRGPLPPKA